jgi:hypothetical protein
MNGPDYTTKPASTVYCHNCGYHHHAQVVHYWNGQGKLMPFDPLDPEFQVQYHYYED